MTWRLPISRRRCRATRAFRARAGACARSLRGTILFLDNVMTPGSLVMVGDEVIKLGDTDDMVTFRNCVRGCQW